MRVLLRYYRKIRECRELSAAYQRLLVAYHEEKERAAHLGLAITEPCPQCETHIRERNDALLELDMARSDLDELQATLCWVEGSFFNGKAPRP